MNDLSDWAKKKFSFILERIEHAPPNFTAKLQRWEERYAEYQAFVPTNLTERRQHAKIMSGINDYVGITRAYVRANILTHGCSKKCYICGLHLNLSHDEWNWDHVFPKAYTRNAYGKSITNGNIMPTHRLCNHTKDARMPFPEEVDRVREAHRNASLEFFTDKPLHYIEKNLQDHPRRVREILAQIESKETV